MSGTEDVAAAVPGPLMFGPLMSGTVEEGAAPSESAAAVAAGALYPARPPVRLPPMPDLASVPPSFSVKVKSA